MLSSAILGFLANFSRRIASCISVATMRERSTKAPSATRFTDLPFCRLLAMSLKGTWSLSTSVRSDVILLCHGGPISMPEDAAYVLSRADRMHGFYGASSAERLPTEMAITKQIKEFKKVQLGKSR